MIYEIELSKLAFKNMSKIPKKELLRIRERIDALAVDPNPRDLKKITGEDNLYQIRSGNYRILYRQTAKTPVSRIILLS